MVFSILGTVVHSYLYATSYIINVLDVLRLFSLQKRRHLFSSYRQAHEESPLILFILLCFYFLFRQHWSFSTEETSAYRPVSWDAKWNNRNETTSNQDNKAYHNSMVARFIKWLNWNIECCCKNKLFKSKRDFVLMINIHWIQCVKIKSVDNVMDKHFFCFFKLFGQSVSLQDF